MPNTLLQQVIRKMKRRQLVLTPAYIPKTKKKVAKATQTTSSSDKSTSTTTTSSGTNLMIEAMNYNMQETRYKELGTNLIQSLSFQNEDYNAKRKFPLSKIYNKIKALKILSIPMGQDNDPYIWFLENQAELRSYLNN